MKRILFVLLACSLLAAEEPAAPLFNAVVQKELTSFATDAAKYQNEYAVKLNARIDKSIAALNEQAKIASKAPVRRAIDDEIVRLEAMRMEIVTPGEPVTIEGEWSFKKTDGWTDVWVIKADGTASSTKTGATGAWKIVTADKVLHIKWSNGAWEEMVLPINPKGTATNSRNGKNTGTATKKEK